MDTSSIRNFYEQVNYPSPTWFNFEKTYVPSCLGEKGKAIMVIGCGTSEANIIANTNPSSTVVGIDFSETSVKISKAIRRHMKLKNVATIHSDFLTFNRTKSKFDMILANGVMHHVPEADTFLHQVNRFLAKDGTFSGMVYHNDRPKAIRKLVKKFRDANMKPSEVREALAANTNPDIKAWVTTYGCLEPNRTEELLDTFFNPYFVEYSAKTLKNLLTPHFRNVSVDAQMHKIHFEASHVV